MIDLPMLGHAFFVYFVVALFITSTIAYTVSFSFKKYVIQYQAKLIGRWMLWFSAVMALFAVVFGLYAYAVAGHDDLSHTMLNQHRNIALVTSFVVLILSLWSAILFNDDKDEGLGFLLIHLSAAAVLLYVAWLGALLVYQFGVGVNHLPSPENHNHRTFKSLKDDNPTQSLDKLISR